jgi:hypothetical protein
MKFVGNIIIREEDKTMSTSKLEVTLDNLQTTLKAKGYLSFEHKTMKNRDKSPLRARANGKIQTWKTRPGQFRLPVKYGLKTCFYIEDSIYLSNKDDWWIV